MPVNEQIIDSVATTNTKVLGDAPSESIAVVYQALAQSIAISMQNAVSQQQAMNQISNAVTTQAVNKLLNLDAEEAVSVLKTMSGNDLAQQLSALLTALNSGQQGVKAAGNTPPPTV